MSYISGMDDPASLYWQSVSALSPLSNIVGLWIEKKKDSILGKASREVY